jgi:hypothetical protein
LNYLLKHRCYRLRDGRWISKFSLDHCEYGVLHSTLYFDPRADLTFDSEAEAKERNRELATNWRQANCPDAELCEDQELAAGIAN